MTNIKFKSCLEAYESATQCPISGSCGKIWRAYADYCRVRKRPRTAQKVYLRALAGNNSSDKGAVTDETERFKLWNDFLSLTRESTNDPTLTIDALMTAVREEHQNTDSHTPNADSSAPSAVQNSSVNDETNDRPPTKIQKIHHPEQAPISSVASNNFNLSFAMPDNIPLPPISEKQDIPMHPIHTLPHLSQPQLPMSDQIQAETKHLLSITQENMPPELMAIWLATDGDSPPSRPEPPLFTASPPKLSDASGKDILGSDMALKLLRILLHSQEGNIFLDVCRGCWAMTSLKEQEVVNAINNFEKQMVRLDIYVIYLISWYYVEFTKNYLNLIFIHIP